MSHAQLDRRVDDVHKAMRALRTSMKGIQIRTAGFKKDHDSLARAIGELVADLETAAPLLNAKPKSGAKPPAKSGT